MHGVVQGGPKISVQIESTIIELKVYKADEGNKGDSSHIENKKKLLRGD